MLRPKFVRRLAWTWAFFGAFLLLVLGMGLFAPPETVEGTGNEITLTDPTGIATSMRVEVADSPEEWPRGLMDRPVVEQGMLFVFPDETARAFWMKNTLVPLDISYFAADGAWVSSATMVPCVEDPCASYPSAGPARYALELPAGGLGRGIGTGWTLSIAR